MTTFPFKNTLSIYMAIFRVYPKLKEYITSRSLCAYPAIEIYTSKSIEFIMPLSKQEEYFVPEFCEEQVSIATTEFSNHPDQEPEDDQKSIKDDDKVFARPSIPPQQAQSIKDGTYVDIIRIFINLNSKYLKNSLTFLFLKLCPRKPEMQIKKLPILKIL